MNAVASSGLAADSHGHFYGTVGPGNFGYLYRLARKLGKYTITDLHDFAYSTVDTSGAGNVIIDNDVLYGTTVNGGTGGYGVVFSYSLKKHKYKELVDFSGPNGAYPNGGVIADNGVLYGTAYSGGPTAVDGIVYSVDETGANFVVRHQFTGQTDGDGPECGLIKGTDGSLYGVTSGFIDSTDGTVFKLDEDGGNYVVIRNFTGADGANPATGGGLVDVAGTLYGTTFKGGAKDYGTLFTMNETGGAFATLHSFTAKGDAGYPGETLVSASGLIFGTAYFSSVDGGVIYEYDPATARFGVELKFKSSAAGDSPIAANLLLAASGKVWGITDSGSEHDFGAAYYFKP